MSAALISRQSGGILWQPPISCARDKSQHDRLQPRLNTALRGQRTTSSPSSSSSSSSSAASRARTEGSLTVQTVNGGEAMRNLHVNIPPVCRFQLCGREMFVLLKKAGGGRCQSRVCAFAREKKSNSRSLPWVTTPFPNNNYYSEHTTVPLQKPAGMQSISFFPLSCPLPELLHLPTRV